MLFQTASFGLLFLGTLAAFYGLPRRFRLMTLGGSSLLFYAASGLLDFLLLITTLVITYQLSLRVTPRGPKWPVVVGILLLFTSLAYFKYSEFIYQNANALLTTINLPALPRFGETILPLGISFYTFQIVAYLIDLSKGRAEHAAGFLRYQVFIMFFGQLIAGPIMRASEYLGQLVDLPGASWEDFRAGTYLILVGLMKKVVIADFLADRVDARFDAVETMSQADAWIAAYLFAFQIFFDFSGYVSIALGLGRMFGIKLRENFRTPYLSRGPGEFWQRWHITLSQWFRDYLYIPLGGNRKGKAREAINLMIVMTLAGLWHGTGWPFVLWGAVHGGYLCISRFMPAHRMRELLPIPARYRARMYDAISVFIFFHLTVLAWIPFRAPDLSTTINMVITALRFDGLSSWVDQAPFFAAVIVMYGLHLLERVITEHIPIRRGAQFLTSPAAQGVAMAVVVLLILIASGGSENAFIYFRF